MKTLLKKSLLTSLCQREEFPLKKGGLGGLFPSLAKRSACPVGRGKGRFEAGVSLVEMMIALVILLLVFLALMQTALVSIDANMTNILRDEAVNIAEMRMDETRNTAFASLASDSLALPVGVDCPATFTDGSANGLRVQRDIRNISNKDFCSRMAVSGAGDTRQVVVEVRWRWKGVDYSHMITSIVRRP